MAPDELRASFVPAQMCHLPSIVDVRRRSISGREPDWDVERYLQWRYDFEGRPDSRGRLMVVAWKDKVLGMIGTEIIRLVRRTETLHALSLMDIMVDPELDGAGLGAWLNMAIFAENPVVIEIGANPNSLGLITRLYHRLPNRKEYIAPLALKKHLAKRVHPNAWASVLAAPIDAALKLWRAITPYRIPSSWSLRDLTRFGPAVEALFDRRWAVNEIMYERSSQYLNWRLFENPRAKYSVLAAFEASDMVAYIAYQVGHRSDGMKVVRLVDWLIDKRYGFKGLSLLVQEIIRRALADGADLISMTPLHARTERSLWRLGFVSRPASEFTTLGVHCSEPVVWPSLLDGSAWYLTEANTDLDGI